MTDDAIWIPPDIVRICAQYLARPENTNGGILRPVLGDGDVSDGTLHACIERGKTLRDRDGCLLARIMLTLSQEQRLSLPEAAQAWEIARHAGGGNFTGGL